MIQFQNQKLLRSILILCLSILLACNSDKPKGNYLIKGKLKGEGLAKIKSIALINLNQETPNTEATALIDGNGQFELWHNYKEPGAFVLMLMDKDSTTSAEQRLLIFSDSKVIELEGEANNFINAKVSGSTLHPEFDAFRVKLMADQDQLAALDKKTDEASALNDTARVNQLNEASAKISAGQMAYIKSVVNKNKDNALGAFLACSYLVEGNAPSFHIPEDCRLVVADVEQAMTAKFPDYYWSKELQKIMNFVREAEKRTAIGANAPSFKALDMNQKECDLQTYKGKNTVLLFWAARNAKSKQWAINFQDYCKKQKDLVILMVSVDYPAEEDFWRSTALGIPATAHIFDPGAREIGGPLYNLKLIPYAIFLDKNGKIKAKDIQAEDVPNLLK